MDYLLRLIRYSKTGALKSWELLHDKSFPLFILSPSTCAMAA